jgi:hypothetical protein
MDDFEIPDDSSTSILGDVTKIKLPGLMVSLTGKIKSYS